MDSTVSDKIKAFFSDYPPRRFSKGQVLISAGDEPGHVYYLEEGRVKQYDLTNRGDEIIVNTFKPPAFFPMSYAINRTPNHYTFEAEADVQLRTAPLDRTVEFIRSQPDVMFDLLSRVYRGTDGLLGRMAHLMASSARSRVLYELLIEARRFGHNDQRGTAIALSESDIAARAGLTRETVSREINKLKAEQVVSVVKNELFVNDLQRLAAIIGPEL